MDFLVLDLDYSSHHSCRQHGRSSVEPGLYSKQALLHGQNPVPPPRYTIPTHLHDEFEQSPSSLTMAEEWTS